MDSRQSKMIFLAIEQGKEDVAKEHLIKGLNANAKDKNGRTLLHAAVEKNLVDIVKGLIDLGARVDKGDLDLIKANQQAIWNKMSSQHPETGQIQIKQTSIRQLLEEAFKKQMQADKAQKIIGGAHLKNKETIAITLSKIFDAYANPSLFSFNWHHKENKKISSEIAKELKNNPDWSWDQCKTLIDNKISPIKNTLEPLGTFKGLLIEIEKLKPELKSNKDHVAAVTL